MVAAVVVTLVLRIVYFIQIQGNPFFDNPIMDEGYHDLWAKEVASGDFTAKLPFFRAPLYPYLLGGFYALFGPNFALIRGLQLLLGAVSPILAFFLARRLFPRESKIAAFTAMAVAVDGILFYYEGDLLLESLLAPLSLLFAILLLRAGERGNPRDWLLTGLALGVFAVTRPNILLFAPPAFLLALGWKGESFSIRAPRFLPAVLLTLGTCLVVFPVTAANVIIGKDRVLIASQGGLNFFLGNNEEANGWSATAPRIMRTDWWGGYEDAVLIPEREAGRTLKPSEVSRYWTQRAAAWWKQHPWEGVVLTVRKIVYFLSGEEFSNNRNLDLFIRDYAPSILPARYLLYFATPLALVGAFRLARVGGIRGRVILAYVAVYAATVVLFFVTARYRVPVRPFLLLLAVVGVDTLLRNTRRSKVRGVAAIGATAAFGFAVNVNPWVHAYVAPPAQFYQSIANIYHERGDSAREIEFQLKTLSIDPAYPDGNLNLGTMYMTRGNPRAARAAFETERRLDPGDGKNLAALAQALSETGLLEEAERAYASADSVGLRDAPTAYNHGVLLERLGRPSDAEVAYRRSVELDSTFVDAWNNLGVLEARAGRLENAIRLWERAMSQRPGDARVQENLDRARARLAGASTRETQKGE